MTAPAKVRMKVRARRFVFSMVSAAIAGCAARQAEPTGVKPSERAPIAVGPNVLVSGAMGAWEHSEYMAHADPRDPNRLMVCAMFYSGARHTLGTGVYASPDDGKTWHFFADTSKYAADPACAYGVDGKAFFSN